MKNMKTTTEIAKIPAKPPLSVSSEQHFVLAKTKFFAAIGCKHPSCQNFDDFLLENRFAQDEFSTFRHQLHPIPILNASQIALGEKLMAFLQKRCRPLSETEKPSEIEVLKAALKNIYCLLPNFTSKNDDSYEKWSGIFLETVSDLPFFFLVRALIYWSKFHKTFPTPVEIRKMAQEEVWAEWRKINNLRIILAQKFPQIENTEKFVTAEQMQKTLEELFH